MKRIVSVIAFVMVFLSIIGGAANAIEDVFSFGSFGRVVLYRQSTLPSHVVIFVSGDGGWNKGVVDMARTLSALDAVVGHHVVNGIPPGVGMESGWRAPCRVHDRVPASPSAA